MKNSLGRAAAAAMLGGLGTAVLMVAASGAGSRVHAQPAAAPAPACQAYAGGKCCDPAVAQHLAKEAIFAACGESAATYLGEKGAKDTCRYLFKTDKPGEEAHVEIYAPAQKEVPEAPNDPFFNWKRVGKVFITASAASPKSAPMLASATGLWMAGAGYTVSVNASTKVCSKAEATKLAKSMR